MIKGDGSMEPSLIEAHHNLHAADFDGAGGWPPAQILGRQRRQGLTNTCAVYLHQSAVRLGHVQDEEDCPGSR